MNNDRIKKYFTNALSSADRNSFEQEMENNEHLKESVSGLEEWLNTSAQNNLSVLETVLKINQKKRHLRKNGK